MQKRHALSLLMVASCLAQPAWASFLEPQGCTDILPEQRSTLADVVVTGQVESTTCTCTDAGVSCKVSFSVDASQKGDLTEGETISISELNVMLDYGCSSVDSNLIKNSLQNSAEFKSPQYLKKQPNGSYTVIPKQSCPGQ